MDHMVVSEGEGSPRGDEIWVVAEQLEGRLRTVALELLGKACELREKLGGLVAMAVLGHKISLLQDTLAAYGADKVYLVDHLALERYSSETYTPVLAKLIMDHSPSIVLFGATYNGRELASRVAARLRTGLTADCTDLQIDEETCGGKRTSGYRSWKHTDADSSSGQRGNRRRGKYRGSGHHRCGGSRLGLKRELPTRGRAGQGPACFRRGKQGGRRRRMVALPSTGRSDREDSSAQALHCHRHIWVRPASRWNADSQDHRRHQPGS